MATMISLPPELLLRISSGLTTPELCAFRRTCKTVETALFKSFAQEFFTKRQFMIEHVSLEALVGIANHPTLSKYLKEVIIGLQILPDRHHRLPLLGKGWDGTSYIKRDVLLATGKAHAMLVEAFSKLPNLKTIGLRDYDASGRERDGPSAYWRSYGWSYDHDSRGLPPSHSRPRDLSSPDTTFVSTLYALGCASIELESIGVFLRRYHKLSSVSCEVVDGSIGEVVIPMLAHVRKLMLHIALDPDETGDDPSKTGAFKRFLSHTPDLELLRLNSDPHQIITDSILGWLGSPVAPLGSAPSTVPAPPIPLRSLTSLELGMLTARAGTLVDVITKFDLISLKLWKVSFLYERGNLSGWGFEHWTDFCTSLAKTLPNASRLSSMFFGYLSEPTPPPGPAPSNANPRYTVAIRFASDGDSSNTKESNIVAQVTYRGHYGSSIKDWLNAIAKSVVAEGSEDIDASDSDIGSPRL